MGHRRQARETALQALYLADVCRFTAEAALKSALDDSHPESIRVFAGKLVNGVLAGREEIDQLLSRYVANWNLNRLTTVDRNILRLSTYEILHERDTPISVIIDEAIEIAKTYSTQESGKFVNGILDKVKVERK